MCWTSSQLVSLINTEGIVSRPFLFQNLLGGVHVRTNAFHISVRGRRRCIDWWSVVWRFGMWMTCTETNVQGKNKEQQHSLPPALRKLQLDVFPQTIDFSLKKSKPPPEQRLPSV